MSDETVRARTAASRLLVVEDDAADRIALRRLVREIDAGIEVVETSCVAEAREALEVDGAWGWIVCDFQLPDGEGRDVLEAAAERFPHSAVIVLTGRGDESLAAELMREGARDYIPKDRLTADRLASSLRTSAALVEAERVARAAREADAFLARAGAELVRSIEFDEVARAAATNALGTFADLAVLEAKTTEDRLERVAFAHVDEDTADCLRERILEEVVSEEWTEAFRDADGGVVYRPDGDDPPFRSSGSAAWLAEMGATHLFAAPLRARERLLGILTIGRCGGEPFGELDLAVLRRYGERVALALDNSKLYRSQRLAVAARDHVLAFVAHDLRNPLNAIVGAATNLLAFEMKPEVRQRQLELVETAARRMTRLVDDLLDVAKLEEGVLRIDPAPGDASEIVSEALALMETRAAEEGLELAADLPADLPRVLVDQARGVQVLVNLIDNAIRHSPEGGRVTVSARPAEDVVRIAVADEGPGIPEAELRRLFEPFWQSSKDSRKGRGGLGLTISRGLVQLHGGRIDASSGPERGAEFVFTLRIADA